MSLVEFVNYDSFPHFLGHKHRLKRAANLKTSGPAQQYSSRGPRQPCSSDARRAGGAPPKCTSCPAALPR